MYLGIKAFEVCDLVVALISNLRGMFHIFLRWRKSTLLKFFVKLIWKLMKELLENHLPTLHLKQWKGLLT